MLLKATGLLHDAHKNHTHTTHTQVLRLLQNKKSHTHIYIWCYVLKLNQPQPRKSLTKLAQCREAHHYATQKIHASRALKETEIKGPKCLDLVRTNHFDVRLTCRAILERSMLDDRPSLPGPRKTALDANLTADIQFNRT